MSIHPDAESGQTLAPVLNKMDRLLRRHRENMPASEAYFEASEVFDREEEGDALTFLPLLEEEVSSVPASFSEGDAPIFPSLKEEALSVPFDLPPTAPAGPLDIPLFPDLEAFSKQELSEAQFMVLRQSVTQALVKELAPLLENRLAAVLAEEVTHLSHMMLKEFSHRVETLLEGAMAGEVEAAIRLQLARNK